MKSSSRYYQFWFLIVCLFICFRVEATPCSTITLSTQAEVDAFPLMECDSINGDLIIHGQGILRLDSLIDLRYVSGSILIDSVSITDLDGLSNVVKVGLELDLSECPLLLNISVINQIDSIDQISIQHCDQLDTIHFNNIYLNGGLNIQFDSILRHIQIDSLKKPYLLTLLIANNPLLETIHGFSLLIEITDFDVSQNYELLEIDAFRDVRIAGRIRIDQNMALTHIDFFDNLSIQGIPTGNLSINHNHSLIEVRFPSLRALTGLLLSDNIQLDHCCFITELLNRDVNFEGFSVGFNGVNCSSFSEVIYNCSFYDPDNDLVLDTADNCPYEINPDQFDWDNDGIGNACDNCSTVYNPGQQDANFNFIGDACENETAKVGVNTNNPQTAFQLENGDIYIKEAARGIIIKNAEGICFRINVDTNGLLRSTPVACP